MRYTEYHAWKAVIKDKKQAVRSYAKVSET